MSPSHSHRHTHSHEHEHEHEHPHGHEHPHPTGGDHDHDHEHHHHDHEHHHRDSDHEHARDHGHPHHHDHDAAERPHAREQRTSRGASARAERPDLERGAGDGRLLFLDAASGVAGDMTIAALVDLGVPFAAVERAVGCLPLEGYRLELQRGFAGAIGASQFDVHVEAGQPERSFAEIDALLAKADLPPRTQSLARAIFRRLAEAEAEVHRVPLGEVHFHEVGAVDAIVDIVGAAACFDFLGADVVASPLPLGRGSVECRHGVLPLPAPAALLCLRGVPTYDAGIEAELVTPTGAAIIATVARAFPSWPSFIPEHVGWGKGARDLPDRPNALRAVLGEPWAAAGSVSASHVVVECNVDDLTGELAGHALSELLRAGALDAWLTPIQMKKGRPGLILSALCPINAADQLGGVLLRETSSLGYRKSPVTRGERPRRQIEVHTPWGAVPVKVSTGPWGSPQIKPEFDVCVRRAEAHAVAVRDVIQVALALAREQLGVGGDSSRS